MDKVNAKGQVESLGLVIVVIILVIAGTFAIVLMTKGKANNVGQTYLTVNANNLRESLFKTRLCDKGSIGDEIDGCNGGNSVCYEKCDAAGLKKKIREIVEKSIDLNFNYNISVTSTDAANSFSIARKDCGSMVTSSSQYTLSGAEIKVILCFS